jgi:hypothetical protein
MKSNLALKAPILLAHAIGQHGLEAEFKLSFNCSTPLIDVISYRGNKVAEYWFVNDVIQEKVLLK